MCLDDIIRFIKKIKLKFREVNQMNIHEYQAKSILKDFGAPIADGIVISSLEEAHQALDLSLIHISEPTRPY